MSKTGMKRLFKLFGVGIFIFILSKTDIPQIVHKFAGVKFSYILLALPIFFLIILVKTWRWHLLLRVQEINFKIKDACLILLASSYFGFLTPGRIGESIKALYIMKKGYSFGTSFVSIFLERLLDVITIVGLGYISILLFREKLEKHFIILGILFLILAILYAKRSLGKTLLHYMFKKMIPDKFKNSLISFYDDFLFGIRKMDINNGVWVFILTICSWLLYFKLMHLLALSLGIKISYLYVGTCVSISALVAMIPVSIFGIGTRDATLIILFSHINLSKESAVSFSVMFLAVYLANLTIGLLAWFKVPLEMEADRLKNV